MTGAGPIHVIHWGLVDYDEARRRQLDLVERRAAGTIPDTLILCEHPPVYTVGRRPEGPIPEGGAIPVRRIERGGGVTYHGPGQIVGYPVIRVDRPGRGIRWLLSTMEASLAEVVESCGLRARPHVEHTGVWASRDGTDWHKVASIGIAVRRWVSFHGFALNVDMNLAPFRTIRPCGLEGGEIGSLRDLGWSGRRDALRIQEAFTGIGWPLSSTAT
ncbi:MAG: lipoyl(octanoyl) transferase LipB [Planctomycetes bacterium]|nr:lipoyl(octanoyl) transferase LipB [Planctomycetota bacterium]